MSNQSIKDFYSNELRKVLNKNSLRAFIRAKKPKALAQMNQLWEENSKLWVDHKEIDGVLAELLIQKLGRHYQEFEKKVNDLLTNGFSVISESESEVDFIILRDIRIIYSKDQLVPSFYFRKNANSGRLGDLKRSWQEVTAKELRRTEIMQFNYESPKRKGKQEVDWLLRHIFMFAVWNQFSSDQFEKTIRFTGMADCDWAMKKIGGIADRDQGFVQDYSFRANERYEEGKRARHIAGMFGYLYLKRNGNELLNEKLQSIKSSIMVYFNKYLNPPEYQYLQKILIKSKVPYYKLSFCMFIEKNKKELAFWEKDSVNKLFYLIYFESKGKGKEDELNEIPSDYFSYENMVDNKSEKAYTFPSKKAMRRGFSLSPDIFSSLLMEGAQDTARTESAVDLTVKMKRNYWRNFMLWLDYVKDHKVLDRAAIESSRTTIENLFLQKTSEKLNKQIPILVDLIYQYFLHEKDNAYCSEEVTEITDYMQGNHYELNENGEMIKTRKKNAYLLGRQTTLKSLKRKSDAWHRDHGFFNQIEVLRRGEDYKTEFYDQYNDLNVTMGGYDFKIIQSHYDLLMEGIEMRHCVESFHKRINRSSYVAFAVKRSHSDPADKANRFTLGLVVGDGMVSLDQCKGVYNAKIDIGLRSAVDELILALNTGRIELMRTKSEALA